MHRAIQSMEETYKKAALELVEAVFTAHESVGLPAPECLMVKELVPGGLEGIHGQVCYADYEALR